jgi:hypothetical protein
MKPNIKFGITGYFRVMKNQVKNNNKEKAIEMIDTMLIYLAKATQNNVGEIEGYKLDIWKNRVWNTLENMGELPPYSNISLESSNKKPRMKSTTTKKDLKIYSFRNRETQEQFTGTREEFRTKFNLNAGGVSELINEVEEVYRKWEKVKN